MKTIGLIPMILLMCLGSLAGQTITLTFTATYNGGHQPLDSIAVLNLTRGGDTTLYGGDTVLVLEYGTGMEDPYTGAKGLLLFPVSPNPAAQSADIRLYLPAAEMVTLKVLDLSGRELAVASQLLQVGHHAFILHPGSENVYLLSVQAGNRQEVQKLVSLKGSGSSAQIVYSGYGGGALQQRLGMSAFLWVPGDSLRFIGFSSAGADTIYDNPGQSQAYAFQIPVMTLPPVAAFTVSDTTVNVNDTVLFTDLSTGSPTSWKWHFGDGDSSMVQHPVHIYDTVGQYSVTLTVSNQAGSASLTKQNYVHVVTSIYPPGFVHCNPSNPTAVVDVTNPTTGKIWMDRNLGAAQVATSSTDVAAYGDLYQWGRFADGHQCRTSAITSTLSSSDTPGHGYFILSPTGLCDWRNPQNNNLWQGVNGANNPCPIGYRLPTNAELDAERLSWNSNNTAGAFASPLKFSTAGLRRVTSGIISYVGTDGLYWASTVNQTNSWGLAFWSSGAVVAYDSPGRARGYSVRCIKD